MSDRIVRQADGEWVTRDLIASTLQTPFSWSDDGDGGYVVNIGDDSVRVVQDTIAFTFKGHEDPFTHSGTAVGVLYALVKAQEDARNHASDIQMAILMRLKDIIGRNE